MKKFLVIYTMGQKGFEQMGNPTPEQNKKREENMQAWFAWKEQCGDSLVDFGAPLGSGEKIDSSGNTPVPPGLIGYSIVQANDMDGAKKLLERHPHIQWSSECAIKCFEMMPLPG